jgi:hypothetical protein
MSNPKEQKIDQAKFNAPDADAAELALARARQAAEDDSAKYGIEGCCVREFWAVVERDGTLIRGRNVLRTAKVGTGQYEVYFTGDVSRGVGVATIGRPFEFTEPAGLIGVALRCCPSQFLPFEIDKGFWVDTHDPDGTDSDRAFHLIVFTH